MNDHQYPDQDVRHPGNDQNLERVLESIADGLIVTDTEGRIVYANAASCQLLAASADGDDTLIGRNCRHSLVSVAGDAAATYLERVMDDREPTEFEFEHAQWNLWFSIHAFPVRDGGISIYFHDITARKIAEDTLRASEVELRRILGSIADPFFVVDTEWRLTYLNAAVRKILEDYGATPETLTGGNVLAALGGVAGGLFEKELRRTLVLRIPTQFEFHHEAWDRWYSCRCYPIAGGGAAIYWVDITDRKAAEKALQDRHDRLDRVVESVTDGFQVIDAHWRYLYANAPARRDMTRAGATDVIGSALWDIFPEYLNTPVEEALNQAMYDRQPAQFEQVMGESRYAVRAFPIKGDGISIYYRDITEEKRAEVSLREREARWHALTNAMPQIVWIAAETGENIYVNQQGVGYTGAPPTTWLGSGWLHFVHPDDTIRARTDWQNSLDNMSPFDTELRLRRFDGAFNWFKVRGILSTARDGADTVWIGTCTDIQDNMEATFRAETADRDKSEFLTHMSHEIRTPLNAIVGLTSLLLQFNADPDKHRQYLATMQDSAKTLTELIGDILEYGRIDAGMAELDETDFSLLPLIEEIIAMTSVKANEKGLSLNLHSDIDPKARFVGDALRIRQIIMNLVANAVKFTDSGRVDVTAKAIAHGSEGRTEICISVRDTGIGIAPDQLERIFERFTQADGSIARRFGGTGLGLAIARRLAQNMGGNIVVESEPGAGAAFTFRVHLKRSRTETEAPKRQTQPTGSRRVLIVDDNAVNAMVARDMLSRLGHACDIVEGGRQALNACRDGNYEIILMDLQMPDMDGFQATRRIRQMERQETTPIIIIAMTARALGEDRDRCLAAGMDGYLAKPFAIDDLAEALARIPSLS